MPWAPPRVTWGMNCHRSHTATWDFWILISLLGNFSSSVMLFLRWDDQNYNWMISLSKGPAIPVGVFFLIIPEIKLANFIANWHISSKVSLNYYPQVKLSYLARETGLGTCKAQSRNIVQDTQPSKTENVPRRQQLSEGGTLGLISCPVSPSLAQLPFLWAPVPVGLGLTLPCMAA